MMSAARRAGFSPKIKLTSPRTPLVLQHEVRKSSILHVPLRNTCGRLGAKSASFRRACTIAASVQESLARGACAEGWKGDVWVLWDLDNLQNFATDETKGFQGRALWAESVLRRLVSLGEQLGRMDRVCVFCNDTTLQSLGGEWLQAYLEARAGGKPIEVTSRPSHQSEAQEQDSSGENYALIGLERPLRASGNKEPSAIDDLDGTQLETPKLSSNQVKFLKNRVRNQRKLKKRMSKRPSRKELQARRAEAAARLKRAADHRASRPSTSAASHVEALVKFTVDNELALVEFTVTGTTKQAADVRLLSRARQAIATKRVACLCVVSDDADMSTVVREARMDGLLTVVVGTNPALHNWATIVLTGAEARRLLSEAEESINIRLGRAQRRVIAEYHNALCSQGNSK